MPLKKLQVTIFKIKDMKTKKNKTNAKHLPNRIMAKEKQGMSLIKNMLSDVIRRRTHTG